MDTKNNKMKTCKHCGAEIASSAKVCPKCGGKNKKPIYLRPWFIIVIALIVIGMIGGTSSDDQDSDAPASSGSAVVENDPAVSAPEIEYIPYDVKTLMNDLNGNALNASKTYKDQYVALTGRLDVIDSNGDYISIVDANDDWAIIGVTCRIKNDAQLDAVSQLSIGDTIVVSGQITDVGEVMGYTLNVDDIKLPG